MQSHEDDPVVLVFFANQRRSSSKYASRGEELYSVQDATLAAGYAQLAAAAVGDKIYVIGGHDSPDPFGGSALGTNEVYDPTTNTWTTKASMPTPRRWLAVGSVNNKIYATGGSNISDTSLAANEEYDLSTDSWAAKANMPTARHVHGVGVVNSRVYAIGGDSLATNEEYDPATNTWATKADMPAGRDEFAISVVNNKIYVIGGEPGLLMTNEQYDPGSSEQVFYVHRRN